MSSLLDWIINYNELCIYYQRQTNDNMISNYLVFYSMFPRQNTCYHGLRRNAHRPSIFFYITKYECFLLPFHLMESADEADDDGVCSAIQSLEKA